MWSQGELVATSMGTTVAVSSLLPRHTYTFTVQGYGGGHASTRSQPVTVTTGAAPATKSCSSAYFNQWGIYENGYYPKQIGTSGAAAGLDVVTYAFKNVHPTTHKCFEAIQASDAGNEDNAGDGAGDAYADYQADVSAGDSVDGKADVYDRGPPQRPGQDQVPGDGQDRQLHGLRRCHDLRHARRLGRHRAHQPPGPAARQPRRPDHAVRTGQLQVQPRHGRHRLHRRAPGVRQHRRLPRLQAGARRPLLLARLDRCAGRFELRALPERHRPHRREAAEPGIRSRGPEELNPTAAQTHWDPVTESSWIHDGTNFWTGDTPQAIKARAAYAKSKGLAGTFAFSLENDDASGTLLNAMTDSLG